MTIHFWTPFTCVIRKEQCKHLAFTESFLVYDISFLESENGIVSSFPLMWQIFFLLLQRVSYILRFPPLLSLLNLVFLSACPLSVSLINAFNYWHFQSPCSFGCHLREILPWREKKETKKRTVSSRGCWNRLGNNQPLPVSQLCCQLTSPHGPLGFSNIVLINRFLPWLECVLLRWVGRGRLGLHSIKP